MRKQLPSMLVVTLILCVFYLTSIYSYLLYHSLAEIIAVVVACGLFMISWNSRKFISNNYFLFIGIAYLFIGCLDLLHALAYQGMGVFPGYGSNLATQLWIGARYLESITLLIAPLFFTRRFDYRSIFASYVLVVTVFLVSVFYLEVFPDCFIDGQGLTPFKKASEYLICMLLTGAVVLVVKHRREFDDRLFRWVCASICLTIGSELLFTIYDNIYGISNLAGHLFKLLSYYYLYKALIETGLSQPYSLLFRELKQSEERYRSLFTNMIDGFAYHQMVFDEKGIPADYIFLEVNEAFGVMTGLEKNRLIGRSVTEVIPGIQDDNTDWIGIYGEVALGGAPTRLENYSQALQRWFKVTAYCPKKGYFVTVFADITETKQMELALYRAKEDLEAKVAERTSELREINRELLQSEKELRDVSARLLTAQEEERKRLAGEIHDGIGSSLTALRFALETAVRRTKKKEEDSEPLDLALKIVSQTITETRRLMADLRPWVLDAKGLVAALHSLCDRFQTISPDISLENVLSVTETNIPDSLKIVVYRIVQEALNNISKYSRADSARVCLIEDKRSLSLSIEDNGCGFTLPENLALGHSGSGGFGIVGMKERAELTHGMFTIESREHEGTVIRVVWQIGELRSAARCPETCT